MAKPTTPAAQPTAQPTTPAQAQQAPAQATATPAAQAQPTVAAAQPLPATTLAQAQASAALARPVRTNRQTGTRIWFWQPIPQGPNGGGTSTYVVYCQNHGGYTNHHTTRKAAKATVYHPQYWCAGCAAVVAARQAPATTPAQATAQAPATTPAQPTAQAPAQAKAQ